MVHVEYGRGGSGRLPQASMASIAAKGPLFVCSIRSNGGLLLPLLMLRGIAILTKAMTAC
jgi:hypothetical protein